MIKEKNYSMAYNVILQIFPKSNTLFFQKGPPPYHSFQRTFKTALSLHNKDNEKSSQKNPTCRQNYHEECEALINKQVNLELYASYVYLAMAYHFDREDVALPGFHKFFKKCADEEREHAEIFMKYQNKRGGKLKLEQIAQPNKYKWSGPLEAVTQALDLEKYVNENLLDLHEVAGEKKDAQLSDFLEATFLDEQVEACKKLSDLITNLQRAGKGLGEYVVDRELDKQ